MNRRLLLVIAVAVLAVGAHAQRTEWTVALDGPASSPTLYPDEKMATSVAVAAGNSMMLIDGRGQVVWTAKEDVLLATPATVADLDGDGTAEVVAARVDAAVVCYGSNGEARWRTGSLAPSAGAYKTVVAADVMPSAGIEILAGFDNGWLYCLGADGATLWRFFGDKFRVGGIAVAGGTFAGSRFLLRPVGVLPDRRAVEHGRDAGCATQAVRGDGEAGGYRGDGVRGPGGRDAGGVFG
jgi:outer membrane protein assembly factor BamB